MCSLGLYCSIVLVLSLPELHSAGTMSHPATAGVPVPASPTTGDVPHPLAMDQSRQSLKAGRGRGRGKGRGRGSLGDPVAVEELHGRHRRKHLPQLSLSKKDTEAVLDQHQKMFGGKQSEQLQQEVQAELIREYLKFMAIKIVDPNVDYAPSEEIDKVWQAHIVLTKKYMQFCVTNNMPAAAYIHRDTFSCKEQEQSYAKTLKMYSQLCLAGDGGHSVLCWPMLDQEHPRAAAEEYYFLESPASGPANKRSRSDALVDDMNKKDMYLQDPDDLASLEPPAKAVQEEVVDEGADDARVEVSDSANVI